MECIKRIVARICGQLPGKAGLAGYAVCCILPCKALQGLKRLDDASTSSQEMVHVGTRRVLLFGLDGSGKSSFMWMCEHPLVEELPAGEVPQPTSGVLRLTRKDISVPDGYKVDLDLCEIGGDERLRPFWPRYIARDVRTIV